MPPSITFDVPPASFVTLATRNVGSYVRIGSDAFIVATRDLPGGTATLLNLADGSENVTPLTQNIEVMELTSASFAVS